MRKMQKINPIEKKSLALKFVLIMVAATSVMLVLTGTWNLVPTLVTEDVTVITVTDYGCVGESVLGRSVVVSDCNAKTGDVISATFYIPAMEINGYYDKVRGKLTNG
jgi:hypothetical protein